MKNEENTNEKTVEELADDLNEVVQGHTEETIQEENVSEEPDSEENKEINSEGTASEQTEDANSEETSLEKKEEAKKSRKGLIITLVVAGILLVGIATAYFSVASHYKDRLFMKTFVNDIDCSGMTLQEVESMLQKEVEEYSLTILEAGGQNEVIEGVKIGIQYGGYKQLQESFEEQNAYLWPKSLFEEQHINAEIVFEYEEEALNTQIAELVCMQAENQTAPVAAAVVYQDHAFVIQDEVYGTQLDNSKVSEVIRASVSSMAREVSLEETGCYVQPAFKKDSAEVIAAKDEANKYLTAKITYSLDGIEVVVDKETIAPWVSVDGTMTVVIDSAKVKKFTDTLGSKYNTPNRSGVITTPTGKQASVEVVGYGRQVGSQADCDQLISEIKEGKTVTRSPIISREATPEGQYAWGTTYVEVDITEQHMWYIVNGVVTFETDVVTGKKGKNDTPTGTYTILEKVPGKYLTGRLVNGKPSYRTWVNYWMRVTWSGIGFHDAGWQKAFGGDRYVSNGSHGCINMPPAKAKEFYGMLSVGCPVVIHY